MTREQLNQIRKDKKLPISYMADSLNIAEGTLKNFFYNRTSSARVEIADPIAKMLGVEVDDIIYSDVEDLKKTIEEMDNPDAVSVIALKRLYEFQLETKDVMHEKEKEEIRKHYERHIEELNKNHARIEAQYERHMETILLDKKWFRLAAVFGVAGFVALFFFIEFMTPGHGWLDLGDNHGILTSIAGGASVIELLAILWLLNKKKNK